MFPFIIRCSVVSPVTYGCAVRRGGLLVTGHGAAFPDDKPEPLTRRNCDHCVAKKVKCSGEAPCVACTRKFVTCVFSIKKRPGPRMRNKRAT
ncbi:unnamed protein product, partial [Phaeothamnion confervicola]